MGGEGGLGDGEGVTQLAHAELAPAQHQEDAHAGGVGQCPGGEDQFFHADNISAFTDMSQGRKGEENLFLAKGAKGKGKAG